MKATLWHIALLLLCAVNAARVSESSRASGSSRAQSSGELGGEEGATWGLGAHFNPWSPRGNAPLLPSRAPQPILPRINQWAARNFNPYLQRVDSINAANLQISGLKPKGSESGEAVAEEAAALDPTGGFSTLQQLQSEIAAKQMTVHMQRQNIQEEQNRIKELQEQLKRDKSDLKTNEKELSQQVALMVKQLTQYQTQLKKSAGESSSKSAKKGSKASKSASKSAKKAKFREIRSDALSDSKVTYDSLSQEVSRETSELSR